MRRTSTTKMSTTGPRCASGTGAGERQEYVRGGRIQARVTLPASGAGSSSGTLARWQEGQCCEARDSEQLAGHGSGRQEGTEAGAGGRGHREHPRPARQQHRERQQRAQAERPAARAGRVS